MWSLFNCYLSGRHDYGMWCEPGAIFLRCVHCGKRSSGWAVISKPQPLPIARAAVVHAPVTAPPLSRPRVVPFDRAAAR